MVTQFLGALNDHYLKMVVSLIAIEEGIRTQSGIQYFSITGMALILPYLLLSGYAGYFSDRFNKRSVLIWTTGFEFVFGFVVLVALYFRSIEFLIAILFILGAQSVFFSPAKFGILPEMLPESLLSNANGALELGRYIAIICGTVLGGAMMKGWSDDAGALGSVVLIVTLAAWLTSFGIQRVAYDGRQRRPPANPWREISAGVDRIVNSPRLKSLVMAITGFDFMVTLLLMNVLLFAKQTMTLDDLGAGLLAGTAGIGIGIGCWVVGRLSGRRLELAYVPLGAVGSGAAIFLLSRSAEFVSGTTACIVVGSAFAGFVIVPLYTALQRRAEVADRGTIIATNNFLNMTGVLAASGVLWLLHDGIGLTPQTIFVGSGLTLVLAATIGLICAKRIRMRLMVLIQLACRTFARSSTRRH